MKRIDRLIEGRRASGGLTDEPRDASHGREYGSVGIEHRHIAEGDGYWLLAFGC